MKKIKTTVKFGLFCFLFALSVGIHAQSQAPVEVVVPGADGEAVFSYKRNTPDPDIKKIPAAITSQRQKDPVEFIRLLSQYIIEKSDSEYDMVKKAHDWVALNIRYDTQSYFSGKYSSQNSNSVISRGTAVCAGYSDVFKMICDNLEIECDIVSGFARGYSSGLFKNENPYNTNHAWNIVTIEGNKYLIDSTWDAGYINGRAFQAKYITDNLFADPQVFIHKHFPYNNGYQLLASTLSAEEFTNIPFLRPLFFQAVETWSGLGKITQVTQGEETYIEFTVKPGYELSYAWKNDKGGQIGNSVHPAKSDVYRIPLKNLKPGKYILQVYARKSGENIGWGCAELGFIVNAAGNV